MKRVPFLVLALVVLGAVGLAPSPAAGGGDFVQAQSAAIGATNDCSNSFSPSIGIFADIQGSLTEFGNVTTLDGDSVGGFPEDQEGGPYVRADGSVISFGQPVGVPQPEGTVLGTYSWMTPGTDPAIGGAEWFTLYRCSDVSPGTGELYSCFGPYGTCPTTAFEAQALVFEAAVDDDTPDPGQTVTVSGLECFGSAGSIALEDDQGTPIDTADSLPVTDDEFSGQVTLPADSAAGAFVAIATCDAGEGVEAQVALTLAVPNTPAAVTPSAPTAAVVAEPRFTG